MDGEDKSKEVIHILLKLLLFVFLLAYVIVTALVCSIVFEPAGISTKIYHGLMIGVLLGIPYAVIFFILLMSPRKKLFIIIGFGIWAALVLCYFIPSSPARLFKEVVASPIPASVTDIKSRMRFMANDHLLILSFKISQEDINDILISKGFSDVQYRIFYNGKLEYGSGISSGTFYLYHPPPWFDPESFKSPQMYKAEIRRRHEQILIYDSNSTQAYLIDRSS